MRKLTILLLLLVLINTVSAENQTINIYLFWAEGCPHCASEKVFLNQLTSENSNIIVHQYEISGNAENLKLIQEVGEKLGVNVKGVPFTVIGEHYIIGWYNEATTGKEILDAINCTMNNQCSDIIAGLTQNTDSNNNTMINLPILGQVNAKEASLPIISIVMGLLDGFNPCAMWILIFLISLLLGVENKIKRWIYGSVFIISSALVYFLFMTAWLNLFIFIGLVTWIRIIIGLIAFYAAYINIKEFVNEPKGCPITGVKKRQKVFTKLKKYIQEKNFILGLLGLFALAFMVNLVELLCSAGLPAVFTQVLAMNELTTIEHYSYILLYILFFMLDDLLVFSIAMITMQETGLSTKYSHYTRLIGGIIMLIIGVLMIIKPEILMFA
ncbi:MAG TPA: hypothetical protein VI790_04545 [Candidatus Nanoarchaeia archaeon]|nr:hypothetical protein [Candidatus Nanoarchaeia archaeon]